MATIIEMPKLSDTMTAGTLVNWLKEEGDAVSNGDMIAEIETDKATMELEVFDDGFLLKQFVVAGDQVDIGTPIAAIGEKGETVEAPSPAAVKGKTPKGEEQPAAEEETKRPSSPADIPTPAPGSIKQRPAPTAPPAPDAGTRTRVSPLARRLAEEKGVDLAQVQGSGPDGRIVKADVLAAASAGTAALPRSAPESTPSPARAMPLAIPAGAPIAEDADIPLSNMRGIIASRLVESKTTVPHFYLETEVDAGPLMQLRAALNANLAELPPEQGGIKFSVTDFILKGSAEALRRVPQINASWMGDRVRQHGAVHLSLAIAIPDGLVTPKIENAHSKTLRQIAVEAKDLAVRARDKKLRPDEFTGSTFTISSLGMLGIESFYAIINPPNAAILSVGTIVKKPVVNERDEIVPGQRMKIGMSCDHRVVDGATAAQYLAALKSILETPALMLV